MAIPPSWEAVETHLHRVLVACVEYVRAYVRVEEVSEDERGATIGQALSQLLVALEEIEDVIDAFGLPEDDE